jgi:hypothetical protein
MNVHMFPVIFDTDTSLSYYTAGVKSKYTVSLFILRIEHLLMHTPRIFLGQDAYVRSMFWKCVCTIKCHNVYCILPLIPIISGAMFVWIFFFSVRGCDKNTQKFYTTLMNSTTQRGMGITITLPAIPLHYGHAHRLASGGLHILIYHWHMSTCKLNVTKNLILRNVFWLNLLLSCISCFNRM